MYNLLYRLEFEVSQPYLLHLILESARIRGPRLFMISSRLCEFNWLYELGRPKCLAIWWSLIGPKHSMNRSKTKRIRDKTNRTTIFLNWTFKQDLAYFWRFNEFEARKPGRTKTTLNRYFHDFAFSGNLDGFYELRSPDFWRNKLFVSRYSAWLIFGCFT